MLGIILVIVCKDFFRFFVIFVFVSDVSFMVLYFGNIKSELFVLVVLKI